MDSEKAAKKLQQILTNSRLDSLTHLPLSAFAARNQVCTGRGTTEVKSLDELAVEAVLHMLTNEPALLMLARELKCHDNFPKRWLPFIWSKGIRMPVI